MIIMLILFVVKFHESVYNLNGILRKNLEFHLQI